jgi:hypothetical protein
MEERKKDDEEEGTTASAHCKGSMCGSWHFIRGVASKWCTVQYVHTSYAPVYSSKVPVVPVASW